MRIVSLEEATTSRTDEAVNTNSQRVTASHPTRADSSPQRGLHSYSEIKTYPRGTIQFDTRISCNPDVTTSSSEAEGVDSAVGVSCDQVTQRPDESDLSRHSEDNREPVTVLAFLGSRSSAQLEFGQTRGDIPCSEARVGRAASPSEAPCVQVIFPRRPCPEAATLATWKVDPQNGSDSESICTEVSAASLGGAPFESCESDRHGEHSDRDSHLLSFALLRPTPMDSKLELESDSDESESGAHFWPFTLLPPIPTDEKDADMHPLADGEDQTRPECEFVWA
jgi:hypothetical protein